MDVVTMACPGVLQVKRRLEGRSCRIGGRETREDTDRGAVLHDSKDFVLGVRAIFSTISREREHKPEKRKKKRRGSY